MRYLAKDGKLFDDEVECSQYENQLDEASKQKDRDYQKLIELQNAAEDAQSKYQQALDEYTKKYRTDTSSIDDLIKYLFS